MCVCVIIHANTAIGKTLAESAVHLYGIHTSCSCRGFKCFSESCPFQHCSLKADLWLRLQFTPLFSLLPLRCWQLGIRCYMAAAEMSYALLSFTIVFFSSSPLLFRFSPHLSSSPAFRPIYKGDRVIRVCAVVSYPIRFYLRFRGLILQSHILLSQSTFPPYRFSCFWGGKKSQLDSSSPQSSASAPAPPRSISPYLENTSSFWLGHLTTAITLYDFI